MNKKKWALLFLFGALVFGYVKLFYKTYNEDTVAKSADCIITLDVKRITTTLIWNFITTPSQWKVGNIFKSGGKKEISWKDMVEIEDYIFAFHVNNQPANVWYVLLKIKNENDFTKGLLQYNFKKLNSNLYLSNNLGIQFLKNGNKILVTNYTTENNSYLALVADEIFIKKSYSSKESLKKTIDANSHLTVYLAANKFLQHDGIITGNFDKNKIEINCSLTQNTLYNFTENNFSYSANSLFTLGFTQPSAAVYGLFSDSSKNKVSKAISINIDSLIRHDNKYYSIELTGIEPRIDSAITYAYDDDFNKVEKVVVNNVLEPAYNFNIAGDSVTNIYNYFLNNKKLEQTDTGQLFTAMPFVKSYCNIKGETLLNITAANYFAQPANKNINCILFLNLLLTKIPASLLKYLPNDLIKATANIESIHLLANKKNEQLIINCLLQKKKNDLPIIKF